jgi:LysR family transcriptional regulator of abg operon
VRQPIPPTDCELLAVVDSGSIRAAARRIGVSQPGLTKSLRLLEKALDAQLLQRGARGVTLTDAGRLFLVRARTVHTELKRAQDELAELGGRRGGSVSIRVASVIGALLMPGTLERFRIKRPDVAVRIVEGTQESLLPLLREGSLDLAACLRMESEQTPGFVVRSLAKVRLVVAGRKGHPMRHARTLAELQHAQWLMIRPRGGKGLLEHVFMDQGLAIPSSAVHCETHGIQLALLTGSNALALMARQMLDQPSATDLLEEIPLRQALPLLTMGLYSRANVPSTAVATQFAAALATTTRQMLRIA